MDSHDCRPLEDPTADPRDLVDPVGATEIAKRLGVRFGTVTRWGQRGLLPPPRWMVGGRPAWDWSDIEDWARVTGRPISDP